MEVKMERDYRDSIEFGFTKINPEIYQKTLEFQQYLLDNGIAWHNPFSDECTPGFECCTSTTKSSKLNYKVPERGRLQHAN